MVDEKLDDRFFDVSVRLAESNLEAALSRFHRECFRMAKTVAGDVAEGKRTMDDLRMVDDFVRSVYTDQPRALAEWEEIMCQFDLSEDTIDDEK
ncbi:MAG: hypothetical protein JOZ02_23010 [Acidobacteria bacterium]|nr:hypothetical protein [Acidobacteriota bacterium]